jgi:hypothetical protein
MSDSRSPGTPGGDPWSAFGVLVAGVLFYGGIGWGLSIWLHADFWIPIGILVGAGFGMYLTFARYSLHSPVDGSTGSTPSPDDGPQNDRGPSDDRGET